MNPEQQRIAIAEACGWKPAPRGRWKLNERVERFRPDYLNDLNAMHEAEKDLILKQQMLYQSMIGKVTGNKCPALFGQIHTTAAQRAEAFLKTLNLWTK